jgi:hypothetical protein
MMRFICTVLFLIFGVTAYASPNPPGYLTFGDRENRDSLCSFVFANSRWLNDEILNRRLDSLIEKSQFSLPTYVLLCVVNVDNGTAQITSIKGIHRTYVIGIRKSFLRLLQKDRHHLAGALFGHELAHIKLREYEICTAPSKDLTLCDAEADIQAALLVESKHVIRLLNLSKHFFYEDFKDDPEKLKLAEASVSYRIISLQLQSVYNPNR